MVSISQPPILGVLLGVWGKWVKHVKYIYNIQNFNPEQVLAVGYTKSTLITDTMMWFDKFSCKRSDLVSTVGRDLVVTVEKRFEGKLLPKTVISTIGLMKMRLTRCRKTIQKCWNSKRNTVWMVSSSLCIQEILICTISWRI